jgi:hypothetical protein
MGRRISGDARHELVQAIGARYGPEELLRRGLGLSTDSISRRTRETRGEIEGHMTSTLEWREDASFEPLTYEKVMWKVASWPT